MTHEHERHMQPGSHESSHDASDALWEAFRDGTLDPDQRAAFEARLRQDEQLARVFERESQWLDMLGQERSFDDAEAFTQRVLARWEAQSQRDVLGRIGRHRMAAIALAWAAVLAIVIGISQTDWWAGSTMPTHQRPEVNPVSALLENANRRYDEQAARMARMLDQSTELMDLETVVVMLMRPVAGSDTAHPDSATPPSSPTQPATSDHGKNR